MKKALCISAAVALALSSAAFAGGKSYSRSGSADSSVQFTVNDCGMLSVESARHACLRSTQPNGAGASNMGKGATLGSGTGSGGGGSGLTTGMSTDLSGELGKGTTAGDMPSSGSASGMGDSAR